MIRVSGVAKVSAPYEVELDMTEEEFDSLSGHKQTELLENTIDWRNVFDSSDTEEIEVYDLEEIEEAD